MESYLYIYIYWYYTIPSYIYIFIFFNWLHGIHSFKASTLSWPAVQGSVSWSLWPPLESRRSTRPPRGRAKRRAPGATKCGRLANPRNIDEMWGVLGVLGSLKMAPCWITKDHPRTLMVTFHSSHTSKLTVCYWTSSFIDDLSHKNGGLSIVILVYWMLSGKNLGAKKWPLLGEEATHS